MLNNNINKFLEFFKLLQATIDNLYGRHYNLISWNPQDDFPIMTLSGLRTIQFNNDSEFYSYMSVLAKSQDIDFYPTFLKIIDLLNLPELDKNLEKIFLGNPHYNCSN